MRHCKRCGVELFDGRTLCLNCRRKWLDKRKAAFNQATSEIGPLNAQNLVAIQKRVKQLERGQP